MNELTNIENRNTMTSLEVAEIAGKRHDNVLADIRDEIRNGKSRPDISGELL